MTVTIGWDNVKILTISNIVVCRVTKGYFQSLESNN